MPAYLPARPMPAAGCPAPVSIFRRTTVAGVLNIMGVLFSSTLFLGAPLLQGGVPLNLSGCHLLVAAHQRSTADA